MGTAQAFYQIFKTLPVNAQLEVRKLINENEEMVEVSLSNLQEGLQEIKVLKKGKSKILTMSELKAALED